ncbi:MAG: leucine-rich repeat protein [Coriobacteriales bacterium]|nr:leucine-rich repeat protein [Coriobacteriales bacterium]
MNETRTKRTAPWRTWTAGFTSVALVLTLFPFSAALAEDGTPNLDEGAYDAPVLEMPAGAEEPTADTLDELDDSLPAESAAGTNDEASNESSDDVAVDLDVTDTDDALELEGEQDPANEDDLVVMVQDDGLELVDDADADDLAIEVQASPTVLHQGYCGNTENGASGKNISWKLYSDGKLALAGTGSTDFYSHEEFWFGSPIWPGWHDYANQITSVSIGEGITELSGGVLANLPKITSVKLPSTMKKLNQCVFFNCPNLTSVTLNDGLTSIGVDVFEGSGVTQLTVPASLSYMDYSNFDEITLDNLTIKGPNAKLSIKDGVLFGDSSKTLLFYSRDKQGAYAVPSGVTKIANCAFEACGGLSSITLPNSLTTIGEGAFWMSGISAPITIPNSVKTIGRQAFGGLNNTISKVHVGSGVTEPSWYMFSYSSGIQSIELAEGPTHLGEGALSGCTSLKSVYFPNSYTTIEENMCNGCTSLTSVRIGPKVKSIGKAAFAECTSLASVSIPNGVTSIGEGAFYNTKLTSVTLPSSVTSIGANAFPASCKVKTASALIPMDDGAYVKPSLATALRYSVTYKQTSARSMLSMINSFRTGSEAWWYTGEVGSSKHKASGLKQLAYDYDLEKTAMVRAREIALLFSHTRPDGRSCFTAFSDAYSSSGENIAIGPATAKEVMEMWKETNYGYSGQGHRRNMLNSGFNAVGIGHAVVNGVHCWVQDFGYADTPNTKKTTAVDKKQTVGTTIYNSSISSVSSVKASKSWLLIKKKGGTATLPTVTGKDVRLTNNGDSTWGSFSCKAAVKWTSNKTSVVTVSGSKAKAVAKYGEATLKASAFGKTVKVKVYVGVKGSVSKLKVKVSNKKYTGKAIKPKPTLKLGGKKLKLGTDYTLSYKNNKKVGKARIIIKGKGHYTGTKTVYFKIVK